MGKPNEHTRRVMVGDVPLGGGAPVVVQSMLNAPADDAAANLAQIEELAAAGCEIVRMAIPHRRDIDVFAQVCSASPLPVVADIHFDAHIAVEAARRGAAKLRINPGNIGGLDKTRAVLDAAGEAGIPIRIGVNAGSLDGALAARDDLTLPQKLARSAADYVRFCEDEGFRDLVVSAKAHDVMTTVRTYRLLAEELPHVPLHIGVTEAGTAPAALGVCLRRVSATRCASRSRTIPCRRFARAGRCLRRSTCVDEPPNWLAVRRAGVARWISSGWPGRWKIASRISTSRSKWR